MIKTKPKRRTNLIMEIIMAWMSLALLAVTIIGLVVDKAGRLG